MVEQAILLALDLRVENLLLSSQEPEIISSARLRVWTDSEEGKFGAMPFHVELRTMSRGTFALEDGKCFARVIGFEVRFLGR